MSEHPILFSGPMVRAILHGTKTQTRRALRPQPDRKLDATVHYDRATGGAMWASIHGDHGTHCPYGKPGERLWVRETWRKAEGVLQYRADPVTWGPTRKWTPAIHMPRVASRLTLEVTGVRVERLQDITERDAIDEGETGTSGYRLLWDDLNGKRGLGWSTNPWVWVVEFRRA